MWRFAAFEKVLTERARHRHAAQRHLFGRVRFGIFAANGVAHDHQLGTYVNALVEAGFRVTRTEEPRPSPDACAAFPAMSLWRDHASLFLYVRATRE